MMMANPVIKLLSNPSLQARILRVMVIVAGLARDFWKDTPFPKKAAKKKTGTSSPPPAFRDVLEEGAQSAATTAQTQQSAGAGGKMWIADTIQIMEKMWGDGVSLPGDDGYIDDLVAPMGLNNTMSVLDLSAGLGGLARKIAKDFNCYVTGLEPDQKIAARGMIMSIAAGKSKQAPVTAYDPAEYKAEKKYDCVFVRDLFCKVIGKEKFFKAVSDSVKPKEKPAITPWLGAERNTAPLTFIEMVKDWKHMGFDMRVAEDQTDVYRAQILRGLAALVEFMADHPPSPDTKPLIVREVNFWAKRIAAFDNGLRYCRFFGIKR
jgi:SAM-dependent methyltransferase